jgi:hypothetical protein
MNYTNHSGGCPGSDMEWEIQGRPYGVKTNAYSFGNHVQYSKNQCKLTAEQLKEGAEQAKKASLTLGRPWKYIENKPYVQNLISRNWYQVKNADCVYAIGKFVKGSTKLVDGGTGWAVQMAIDNKKAIFFYDQPTKEWYTFDYQTNIFVLARESKNPMFDIISSAPMLTENFAGIGTREINDDGKKAITNTYRATFGK